MWREMRGERKRERERESKKERIAMSLCERAKSLCCSGRLAPSPDAGSLPLLLMIMKLVCVKIQFMGIPDVDGGSRTFLTARARAASSVLSVAQLKPD